MGRDIALDLTLKGRHMSNTSEHNSNKTQNSLNKGRAAVILAAGKSTRMKSAKSKVLHEVGGLPMLSWVTKLARDAGVEKIIAVVGESNKDVRAHAESLGLEIALQEPQLGTGHAVQCAQENLAGFDGGVVVRAGRINVG